MDIKKERLGGVDLFRVISMFMVVVLHVNGIGGVLRNPANQPLSPLWFASSVINILCVIAVNCFALIT
jgi:surface polysaccharide O-acyltransferase-like enzyme